MSINLNEPMFLALPRVIIDQKIEEIVNCLEPIMKESRIPGSPPEQYRQMGTWFIRAFLNIQKSGATKFKLKEIYGQMVQMTVSSQNLRISQQNMKIAVDNLLYLDSVEFDLEVVNDLLKKSNFLPIVKDVSSFALLNAFTQVAVSNTCPATLHFRWVPVFAYVFFCNFLGALQISIELQKVDTLHKPIQTRYRPYPRGKFPQHVKNELEHIFDQVGAFSYHDMDVLAERYKDHMTLRQIKIYFKNLRMKRKMKRNSIGRGPVEG